MSSALASSATEKTYAKEADLCADFVAWVKRGGISGHYPTREPWTVYPETANFDLLLVDGGGRQLGIEAKLRMNPKVLAQALPDSYGEGEGPDWRGVLVPSVNPELASIARLLGLIIFRPERLNYPRPGRDIDFRPWLSDAEQGDNWHGAWHDWNPAKRCALPSLVPDVPAGVPCPVRLTPWKEGALKVLAHLEAHGSITAKQVRYYGVDPRRFCASDGWLASAGGGQWTRGRVPDFDKQHPAEYAVFLQRAREMIP